MKVNELSNLWVGINVVEDFRVLIVALDKEEAQEIVNNYCLNSHMKGGFSIIEFNSLETQFNCDYVLTGGQ